MDLYKVGVIGCGGISPMHLQSLKMIDSVELVAVCDIRGDRAKIAAHRYECRHYSDYKEMLDNEQLDVVHILTPHYLHAPMTIYAAKNGINVLTEKPMAITLEAADDMIKACNDNNVTLGVIFQNRSNPGSTLIKNSITSGELGAIISARMAVMWHRADSYYSDSDWKGRWDKEGGGVIINQSIHTIDLMRWFIDSPAEYIEANISNRAHPSIEVEDCADGIIKYKNGVSSWFYAMNNYSYDAPIELELHCENGMARLIAERATITFNDGRELTADRCEDEFLDYGDGTKSYWGLGHFNQIQQFYNAFYQGEQPSVNGYEARKTQEIVSAIYKSGRENKRVYL